MRLILVGLCAAACAYALDNSVTVYNNFTGVLTTHPIYFGRPFARGELANYCKPFATPSNTGTRAAITAWQCEVLNRWNDTSATQTVTAARYGSPTWSSTPGGVTSVVIGAPDPSYTGKITFLNDHNLALGDRLVMSGAPAGANFPSNPDNVIVHEITSTKIVKYLSRASVSGVFQATGTYTTGVSIVQKIDPSEPVDVCRLTVPNHGFYRGEEVTISGSSGLTILNPLPGNTYLITGHTRNEFVINASCSGTYAGGWSVTGTSTGAGSVQFAMVAVKTTVPSGGSTRIDFVNSTDPSSAGDAAATAAAGFDKTAMLAATWNTDFEATAVVKSGATAMLATSARTLLTKWNETQSYCGPRYWTRGPVMTMLILEYGCKSDIGATISADAAYQTTLPTDFGWKIRPATTFSSAVAAVDTTLNMTSVTDIDVGTILYVFTSDSNTETMTVTQKNPGTCTAPCVVVTRATTGTAKAYASLHTVASMQWEDATAAYKNLHPIFTLKFINGFSGVGMRTEIHNDWWWAQQSSFYSMVLKTGGTPASRLTGTTLKHLNHTSLQISTWDGTDPEFYCSGGSGTDPDNCSTTGGGTRTRKYLIDHNTPYLSYARAIPEYLMYSGGLAGSVTSYNTGFNAGDKGSVLGGTLGGGTFNLNPEDFGSSALKGFDGAAEAYTFGHTQTLCLQAWSGPCYNIVFGDTIGGGGGNAEAQIHVPYHFKENDATQPRYFMPGFNAPEDQAFSRYLGLYPRPTYATPITSRNSSGSSSWDIGRTACTTAAPAIPPSTSGDGTASAGVKAYPCYGGNNTTGHDGWILDGTHVSDWNEWPYMTTAEPRYLQAIYSMATFMNGREPSGPPNGSSGGGRNIGRSWTQSETGGTQPTEERQQGAWVRSVLAAARWAPNVPQFGYSVPAVDTFYYREKLVDMAHSKEGFWNIKDGSFGTMYPDNTAARTFSGTCPSATHANSSNGVNIWYYVRCSIAQELSIPIAFHGLTQEGGSCAVQAAEFLWLDCTNGSYSLHGNWYYHNNSVQWARAAALGFNYFDKVRRFFADFAFSVWGSSNWNPFVNGLYHSPIRLSGGFVQTFAQMYAGLKPSYQTVQNFTYNNAGNVATTPFGYFPQWIGDLASLSDLKDTVVGTADGCTEGTKTPGGCTWRNAWNWYHQNLPDQNLYTTVNKYVLAPRADITDLACTPGGTSAICTYTAPTNDACTYLLGTSAPTSTLDNADTSDGGGGRARRVVLTSLTQSTAYFFRLTCGQRVSTVASGTGRTSTTFTTVATGSATTVSLQLGAVSYAATVTVDYGSTTAVTTGTIGPITCTSGCTISIPGVANSILYYKVTRQTAGGTVVASGAAQKVMAL